MQKRSETASPKSSKTNGLVSVRLFYVKQLVRKPSISTLWPLRRSEFTFYCSLILRARRIYFPPFLVWFYRLPQIFVDVDERKQLGIYIKPSWLLLYLLSACRSWIPPKSIFHDWTPDDSLIVARRTSLCVDIFNSERCMLYIMDREYDVEQGGWG